MLLVAVMANEPYMYEERWIRTELGYAEEAIIRQRAIEAEKECRDNQGNVTFRLNSNI